MYVYVQVTRGMEYGRNHAFPVGGQTHRVRDGVTTCRCSRTSSERTGIEPSPCEDFRWGRCDIKTTALLANVLMKQQAADAGANEAIIVRDGEVLEGSSTSVFVVSRRRHRDAAQQSSHSAGHHARCCAVDLRPSVMPVEVRKISVEELLRSG